jgi:Kef-type K+ transport system membrane component KefB
MLQFLIDVLVFLVAPVLCWRLIRGVVPMAVLPILFGLAISVAATRFGFDKSIVGPSKLGETIGWLGVLVLAFTAGLETRMMAATHAPAGPRLVGTAVTALAIPFLLGAGAIATGMFDLVLAAPKGVPPLLGAAAIGLCLAVSALPVLIGIVRELPGADRPLGLVSLRIAALDDAILWIGLAVILALQAGQGGSLLTFDWRHGLAVAVFVAMALARRPLDRWSEPPLPVALLAGVACLAAGVWATTTLGLHELLGAYFAGMLMPIGIVRKLKPETLGRFALFGVSPLFFGHRGLSIDGSVVTPIALLFAVGIFAVSGLAKLAAVHLAPPEAGMPAMERTRLGMLLQCKGLMEIVAATILMKAGLITQTSFAILVTMAVVSTSLTVPMFRWVSRAIARRRAASPGGAPQSP